MQDEELESEEIKTPTVDTTDEALNLINLDGLIKNHLSRINKIRGDLREQNQILGDVLSNDPIYREHDEKAKEAAKTKSMTRNQILKTPQAADLDGKIKALRSESKELAQALSDYLQEYQRLSGANEIEDEDGEVRQIVYIAKLIKRSLH